LCGVYFDRNERGKLRLVSTDGRRLHIYDDVDGELVEYLTAHKVNVDGLIGGIYEVIRKSGLMLIDRKIDSDYYPNYRKILDGLDLYPDSLPVSAFKKYDYSYAYYTVYRSGVILNAAYMLDLFKSCESWAYSIPRRVTSAALFRAETIIGEATAVIMPMDNRDEPIDAWLANRDKQPDGKPDDPVAQIKSALWPARSTRRRPISAF
jgi:hypothetical protein